MTNERRAMGDQGETAAEAVLKALGFQIVQRNYYTPYGELDIVAKDRGYWVFVEVKSRTAYSYGNGLDAVTRTKRRRLSRAAQIYLLKNLIVNQPCRFDVISLRMGVGGKIMDYTHVPGAFEFEGGNYY